MNPVTVDYTPLVNAALQTAGLVLVAVATWATHRFGINQSAQANSAQQANYDTALKKSLAAAFDQCKTQVLEWGSAHPTVVPVLIDTAAAVLLKRFPGTAAAVGAKSPADVEDALRRVLATLPVVPAPTKP